MSASALVQLCVFLGLTGLVGLITWLQCRRVVRSGDEVRDQFLAGGGLSWVFIAGSLTLTNISTDTLVGWNGNQLLLVLCWELAGVPGLILLAKVFVPLYYKYNCTTVTELLERRYGGNKHIRATVGGIFLLGSVLIFLPAMLYTSSLLMKSLFSLDVPL
ncbi:MAG: solute:Na+ symporter, family, partial [Verrucomicrobiota bacterium]|nr:solute:Na+ symporter, family [Verrucomicrobiota bacterium]